MFCFFNAKNDVHSVNKRLLWQHLIRMVIDEICKTTFKGVKSKSESFFSISHGALELLRKTLGGGGFRPPPPGMDRVKDLGFFRENFFKALYIT